MTTFDRSAFTGTPFVGMIVRDMGRQLRLIEVVHFNERLGKTYCMFEDIEAPTTKIGFFI